MSKKETDQSRMSRRGFLQTSAVAAGGVAAVAAPAAAVKALETQTPGDHLPAVVTHPSGPTPAEPVMAYLRDVKASEVTVMSGTSETTYKDPVLAQRLLGLVGPEINGGGI